MIRLTLLWLVVFGILAYSWKDWYRALCGLILLMAVIEHPDMPKSIFGIPGLNPWNLLMFNITLAWWVQRKKEGLRFDLPSHVTVLLLLYLVLVLVGFSRIIGDTHFLVLYYREGMIYFITEFLVNTIKWVVPALLLYDGCRNEERFRLALFSILAVYFLLSVQIAKWVPPTYALDGELLERRTLRVLLGGMGFHRVNLSAMLSGASWAVLCARVMVPVAYRLPVLFGMLFMVYAQMLTGGRAGYGAWVVVGLILCVLKWRRYLLLVPVAAALSMTLLPGVVGRVVQGFTAETRDTNRRLEAESRPRDPNAEFHAYTETARRSVAWPLIIEGIKERPLFGLGRQAMLRSGIATFLYDSYGELFPHPHNAYLELLLDNGIVGAAIILPFYALMLWYSMRLFLDRQSVTCSAIGGVSMALILSLLVSAVGSQTFYPREGWLGMWCAMMLMLRVRVERKKRANHGVSPALAPANGVSPSRGLWGNVAPRRALAQSVTPPASVSTPAITWRPRGAPAPVRATPSRPAAAAPLRNANRPPPHQPFRPLGRAATGATRLTRAPLWLLGSRTVSDHLVWERA